MTRRDYIRTMGAGFGMVGLAGLLGAEMSKSPLAPRAPHFAPKAKRIIWLCQSGGPSHLETFDCRPKLAKLDGQPMPESFTKG